MCLSQQDVRIIYVYIYIYYRFISKLLKILKAILLEEHTLEIPSYIHSVAELHFCSKAVYIFVIKRENDLYENQFFKNN